MKHFYLQRVVGFLILGFFSLPNQALEKTKTKKDIPAVETINYSVGMSYQLSKVGGDGTVITWKVESIKDNIATLSNSNCEIDAALDKPFAPDLAWRNCSWGSGSHTITASKGQALPLKVGSKFQYSFKGKNDTGGAWESTRKCKVKKKYEVSVPMGDFDTFMLVCKDKWRTRTWWVSPEQQFWIAVKNAKNSGGSKTYEVLSVTRP